KLEKLKEKLLSATTDEEKAKINDKIKKLEDKNFNVLAKGDFRLINSIKQRKADKAVKDTTIIVPIGGSREKEVEKVKSEAMEKFMETYRHPIAQSVMHKRDTEKATDFIHGLSKGERE